MRRIQTLFQGRTITLRQFFNATIYARSHFRSTSTAFGCSHAREPLHCLRRMKKPTTFNRGLRRVRRPLPTSGGRDQRTLIARAQVNDQCT
jgi:hypothetical protein